MGGEHIEYAWMAIKILMFLPFVFPHCWINILKSFSGVCGKRVGKGFGPWHPWSRNNSLYISLPGHGIPSTKCPFELNMGWFFSPKNMLRLWLLKQALPTCAPFSPHLPFWCFWTWSPFAIAYLPRLFCRCHPCALQLLLQTLNSQIKLTSSVVCVFIVLD